MTPVFASVLLSAASPRSGGNFMDCGGSPLCGVLTLETGLGPGAYQHDFVSVHGLWPETGSYGSSQCIKPASSSDPKKVYTCYDHPGGSGMAPIQFETHEWEKHGTCAGVRDETDFFTQVCGLAYAPLKVMAAARSAGHVDLAGYASRLRAAGIAVFSTDARNMQLMLSACAGSDGRWKLADVSSFGSTCPGSGPAPGPAPTPPSGQCKRNTHGPPCRADGDCHFPGCVRCAHSGYCTDQPLSGSIVDASKHASPSAMNVSLVEAPKPPVPPAMNVSLVEAPQPASPSVTNASLVEASAPDDPRRFGA